MTSPRVIDIRIDGQSWSLVIGSRGDLWQCLILRDGQPLDMPFNPRVADSPEAVVVLAFATLTMALIA